MSKNKEDKIWGPWITESDFYKRLPYNLCIYLRKEDSKNWINIKEALDYFHIPLNPTNKKTSIPYASKYLVKWNKLIINTFFFIS